MDKRVKILFFWLLFFLLLPTPLFAEANLVSLTINEEIIPGPDNIYLTATGVYSDGTTRPVTGISWYSSNTNIAEISSSGRLRFTGEGGPLTVYARKDGISGHKTVVVEPWVEDMEIETDFVYSENPYRLMLYAKLSDGGYRYLGPEDGVIWSTTNPWVAWVNNQGVVTFSGEDGFVMIKAVLGKLTDTVSVRVSREGDEADAYRTGIKIKETISFSETPQTLALVAIMSDGTEAEIDNSAADWSSSNHEVAVINSAGVISFTGKPGLTTIKVSYGGYHYEQVVAVGRFLVSLAINESLNYTTAWDGKKLPLSVTAKYNDGSELLQSGGLTWSVDNEKVARITQDGVLSFTGQGGIVTVSVQGESFGEVLVEDSQTIEVPATGKPVPQRFFIGLNPVSAEESMEAKAYCIYSDGSLRDVSEQVVWNSGTPDTCSVYQGRIYLSPLPGPIRISAFYQGFHDQVLGYNHKLPGKEERICQLRIKQHALPFSFKPVQLTALAVMGNGEVRDVTSRVSWRSSQPLVVEIKNGLMTFTGRTGKAVISAQGYGFRDELNIEVTPAELQPQVERLVIEGELTRAAVQLRAVAQYNDGTVRDVTDVAVWNTSNKNTAVVAQNGQVMFPEGLGPVTITASFAGQEASVTRH